MGLIKWLVLVFVICCNVLAGHAQSGITELSKKFNSYQTSWPKAKLHLVFNQPKFSPGDTVWFKAYFLKENLTRMEGKYLIDVNLVNNQGLAVHHLIFQINDGLGQNQLSVPDSLSAGVYLITAHRFMHHVDPDLTFKKEITIVKQHAIVKEDKPIAKVAAEGRHLIRDVPNKVAIQTSQAGSIVRVIDTTGKEVNRVTTDAHGTASFILTPLRNMSYSLKLAGEVDEIQLPPTEEDGCAIILTRSTKHELIKIQFAAPPGSAYRKEDLVVMMISRGKIFYATTIVQGSTESVEVQVPLKELTEGVAHVSLLTQAGKILGSRDFYYPGSNELQVNIQADKTYFQTGDKVRLPVSIKNLSGLPVEGEFSVRVLHAELFNAEQQISITDDLIFPSDVTAKFPINRSDSIVLESLDNVLIAFSKDLPWDKIISNGISTQQFSSVSIIEKKGKAYFTDTHLPVPDFTQIMVYLQKSKIHRETFTQGNGKFWLTLPEMVDQDEFFYLARVKGSNEIIHVNVVWEDESIKLPHAPNSREIESLDNYAAFATKKKIIDQSFNDEEFSPDNALLTSNDFESVIAKADIIKNIQDYIIFPSMEELLKEVIPSVFYRKAKTKNIVRVQLLPPMKATHDPVYIIDGIATKNTSFFLSLKPADLLTLKIIRDPKKLYPLGLLGKNGIIIIQTRKGDVRDQPEDPDKRVEGISKPENFNSLTLFDNKHSQQHPDFRSTIYWNPSLKTNSTGEATVEFVCSDDVGKLLINISGITSTGRPFSKNHEIKVGIAPEKK